MPAHLELRAKEPVARCLLRRLVVPRVYFDAPWPRNDSTQRTTCSRSMRDGNGNTHVVTVRNVGCRRTPPKSPRSYCRRRAFPVDCFPSWDGRRNGHPRPRIERSACTRRARPGAWASSKSWRWPAETSARTSSLRRSDSLDRSMELSKSVLGIARGRYSVLGAGAWLISNSVHRYRIRFPPQSISGSGVNVTAPLHFRFLISRPDGVAEQTVSARVRPRRFPRRRDLRPQRLRSPCGAGLAPREGHSKPLVAEIGGTIAYTRADAPSRAGNLRSAVSFRTATRSSWRRGDSEANLRSPCRGGFGIST